MYVITFEQLGKRSAWLGFNKRSDARDYIQRFADRLAERYPQFWLEKSSDVLSVRDPDQPAAMYYRIEEGK